MRWKRFKNTARLAAAGLRSKEFCVAILSAKAATTLSPNPKGSDFLEEPGFFSGVFEPIEKLMTAVLTALYSLTEMLGVPSYGLAIILLTVLIKILVYPLTKKQLQSMKAMQRIQPQMKKLQEKYKNNPQLMQQKLMELYQKEGANPMSGCLPMLIQMPILMGMYYTLYSFDYGGAAPSFLWLPSLVPFHGHDFPSTKDDVEHERSQYANARNDDSDAVVYRLDKFAIPGGLGALLGDDERRANYSAMVDEQTGR